MSVPNAGSLVGNLLGNALVVNNYSVFDMVGQGQGLLGGLVGDYAGVRYMVSREAVEVRPLQSYILNNYNMLLKMQKTILLRISHTKVMANCYIL